MAVQQKGAYLLYFEFPGELWIQRPREQWLRSPLVYVGSAMGSQGFQRVARHLRFHQKKPRSPRPPHWHIDQILGATLPSRIYLIPSDHPIECSLAELLQGRFEIAALGFGSSDCSCKSHLFHAPWFDIEKILQEHSIPFVRLCIAEDSGDLQISEDDPLSIKIERSGPGPHPVIQTLKNGW